MEADLKINSVEAAVNDWMKREASFIKRYGQDILKDRDFLKAKNDAWKQIYNEFRGKPLSTHEKIDHRILKGQIKQLEREIYKIPIIRLIRNLLLLAFQIIKFAVKQLAVLEQKMDKPTKSTSYKNVLTRHIPAKSNNQSYQNKLNNQTQPAPAKSMNSNATARNVHSNPANNQMQKRRTFNRPRVVANTGSATGLKR